MNDNASGSETSAAKAKGPPAGAGVESVARTRGDIAALLTRHFFAQALGLVRNFLVLPFLGPAHLGVFRLVQQISAYSRYLSMGALSTLSVRYPEWEAAGHHDQCDSVQRLALSQSLLGAVLFIPIFALLVQGMGLSTPALIVLSLAAGFPLLSIYTATSFNVRGQFRRLARIDMLIAVAGLACLLAGVLLWGLHGALIGAFIPPVLRVILGREFLSVKRAKRKWSEAIEHLRFGIRVWAGSTLSHFAMTADLLLLGFLLPEGSEILGYYAVGLMVAQVLAQDLTAVTAVQQRALRRTIGQEGGVTGDRVASSILRLLGTDAFVGICFAAAILLMTWIFIPVLLRAYTPALPGLGPLLTSIIFIKARVYTRTALQNANRPHLVLLAPLLQLAILVVLYPVLLSEHGSPLTLGLGRLGAFLLSGALEIVVAWRIMGKGWQCLSHAGRLFACLVPAALGFIVLPVTTHFGPLAVTGLVVAVAGSFLLYNLLFDGAAREGVTLLRHVLRRAIPGLA